MLFLSYVQEIVSVCSIHKISLGVFVKFPRTCHYVTCYNIGFFVKQKVMTFNVMYFFIELQHRKESPGLIDFVI